MFGAYFDGVIIAAAINAILALGLYISVATGLFSIGHGGFMAVGAYASSILTMKLGWSLIPAILAGGGVAFVIGGVVALPITRFALIYLAMATLGFGEIVRSILSTVEYIGAVNGMRGMTGTTLWMVIVILAILIILYSLYDRSRWGLACQAVRQDPAAAGAMGINVRNVKVTAFAIGAAVTGIGGALYAHQIYFIDPESFAFPMSIAIVLFVIFGGMEIFWGAILGAILLTILPEIFTFLKDWYLFVYGAIFVIMMIWRPQGIIDRAVTNAVTQWASGLVRFRPRSGRDR